MHVIKLDKDNEKYNDTVYFDSIYLHFLIIIRGIRGCGEGGEALGNILCWTFGEMVRANEKFGESGEALGNFGEMVRANEKFCVSEFWWSGKWKVVPR